MLRNAYRYVKQFDRNLWILSVGWFVSSLGFAVSIPFIAIYFHSNLNMSMSQIGLFFGAMAVVRSVFQAVAGEMSDRMERRYLLIYSQLFRSVAFALLAVAMYHGWGFIPIASFLLINSVFGAVYQPTANAMVSDIMPKAQRLDGYAITRSAGNLGWAVGPAIGGFTADYSYGTLFVISTAVTLASAMIFWLFLNSPKTAVTAERFRLKDIIAIKDDPFLARHCMLIFLLYLVVAQLMAPFSVYAVNMAGISEHQLGLLYTLNGLMVVALQIPVTNLMRKRKLTTQLAAGAFLYAVGYGSVGILTGFHFFAAAIIVVTLGEILMSPPSLTLTAQLAPEGRMGRYMGTFGFFVASGWSFGPLYGGVVLDRFGNHPAAAWMAISSLALVAGILYLTFGRKLPEKFNRRERQPNG